MASLQGMPPFAAGCLIGEGINHALRGEWFISAWLGTVGVLALVASIRWNFANVEVPHAD